MKNLSLYPTDVRRTIGRARLGRDITDRSTLNLRAREHCAGGGLQIADTHRDLVQLDGRGHHRNLDTLPLIACQAYIVT